MTAKVDWADGQTVHATDLNALGTEVNQLINTVKVCRLNTSYTLTSSTSVQKLFNSSANGRVNLVAGTYRFNCLFGLSSMSATSGNASFSIAVGTAVIGTVLAFAVGRDGSVNAVANVDGVLSNTAAFPQPMHLAQTTTSMQSCITGTFEVNTAGTIIPSIQLADAAAAVVAAGSYFECWRIGTDSFTVAPSSDWD